MYESRIHRLVVSLATTETTPRPPPYLHGRSSVAVMAVYYKVSILNPSRQVRRPYKAKSQDHLRDLLLRVPERHKIRLSRDNLR